MCPLKDQTRWKTHRWPHATKLRRTQFATDDSLSETGVVFVTQIENQTAHLVLVARRVMCPIHLGFNLLGTVID